MEPVNLDNTKQLERIAAALEDISRGMHQCAEFPLLKIAEAVFKRNSIEADRDAHAAKEAWEAETTGAEPAGIPILLIVEVLIALIKIFRRLNVDTIEDAKLRALSRKLEPYQPVRPAGKEAE